MHLFNLKDDKIKNLIAKLDENQIISKKNKF